MHMLESAKVHDTLYNRSVRATAAVLGTLLGLAGAINHGMFEILQGNVATGGLFIEAIGPAHRFWIHGTEGAISVLPTFLMSGIAVVLFSLAVIVWSLAYIHTKNGATVFLLLMVGLTLVGGGLGHIILFLPTWAYATRITAPLSWWRKVLKPNARNVLSRLWEPALGITAISWIIVMELGILGYIPGIEDPDLILSITLGFVVLTAILANVAFICSISRDVEATETHPASV